MTLFCWGAAYGYLEIHKCEDSCPAKRVKTKEGYSFQSRWNENGRLPLITVHSEAEFFDILFAKNINSNSAVLFDDFWALACWNWIIQSESAEYFSELSQRYQAAKSFGISPARNFDDCPAQLLDDLLIMERELELANRRKAKQDAQANRQRV